MLRAKTVSNTASAKFLTSDKRIVTAVLCLFGAAVLVFSHILLSGDYLPHQFCYAGDKKLVSANALGDTVIGLAYLPAYFRDAVVAGAPFRARTAVRKPLLAVRNFHRKLRRGSFLGSLDPVEPTLLAVDGSQTAYCAHYVCHRSGVVVFCR